jgi:hypothetical protein
MENLGVYLLRSGTLLAVLYTFYWLLLRNETYYSWNRFYLLISIISSMVFPLFHLNITFNNTVNILDPIGYFITDQQVYSEIAINNSGSLSILSTIYICGAVLFLLRFLSGFMHICFLYFKFPKYRIHGFKTVLLDTNPSPFTFFNVLFISANDLKKDNINEMIVHEKAHRDEYHSFDIVALEILTIIQWFNPFIWLMSYSLRSEHEFIADNKVIEKGFDKHDYQKLLLSNCMGITSAYLANNFNYSLLKKRIKMMTTKRSTSKVHVKYFISFPVIVFAIALSVIHARSNAQEDTQPEIAASYNNGTWEGIMPDIMKHITFPESAKKNNVSAKIYIQFVIDEEGKVTDVQTIRRDITDPTGHEILIKDYKPGSDPAVNDKAVADMEAQAIKAVMQLKGFTPAMNNGKNVKSEILIPIVFAFK